MTEKTHILVVEDDPLVSEIIAAALDETYRTTLVGTATEALAQLRDGTVGLMLLDCTLPGGLDDSLIYEADRLGAPVILMSGDRARIEKLVDAPRPYVLKPFTLADLLATVEQVLSNGSVEDGRASV